jgi:hypothetical protein
MNVVKSKNISIVLVAQYSNVSASILEGSNLNVFQFRSDSVHETRQLIEGEAIYKNNQVKMYYEAQPPAK